MPSTNGHKKTAVLYCRVSTDEQARSGFSLAQQLEALREYAASEGYEVLEEVTDPGQSGASLSRPGMDRVRDLVQSGGVSVVLAQDRDRFAREPAYLYLLKQEFAEYGAKIRALNDRGDDSPEGQLSDGKIDQIAKFERAKTTERMRRGKMRKAREGKIIAGRQPDYGFKYNATRDGYEVDEEKMQIVRRIFYMAGVEGRSLHEIISVFVAEGVRTPTGKKIWSRTLIRNFIGDDVYKPHTYQQVENLVAPEVAARLNPECCYGIWWFNRRKTKTTQISINGRNGKEYKKQAKWTLRAPEEWIGVPVPDSGVPREWVDAARAALKGNHWSSNAGRRFWELSGGIMHCGGCGHAMVSHTTTLKSGSTYFYYACRTKYHRDRKACTQNKLFPAAKLEA
jgi:site-specific DNA recombinase